VFNPLAHRRRDCFPISRQVVFFPAFAGVAQSLNAADHNPHQRGTTSVDETTLPPMMPLLRMLPCGLRAWAPPHHRVLDLPIERDLAGRRSWRRRDKIR
jgi:hypothetical protein